MVWNWPMSQAVLVAWLSKWLVQTTIGTLWRGRRNEVKKDLSPLTAILDGYYPTQSMEPLTSVMLHTLIWLSKAKNPPFNRVKTAFLWTKVFGSLNLSVSAIWQKTGMSNANHLKLTSNETEIGTKSSCPGKKTTSCLPCYQLYQLHLRSLHHKLRKEPSLLSEYNTVIQDQLKPGSSRRCQPKIWRRSIAKLYLPHLAVIQKEHETTKVRVVYDGSEKASKHEKSLNDCLQTGLNHLLHVFNMFLDFCNNIVGLIVEMEKAFLMVGIHKVL